MVLCHHRDISGATNPSCPQIKIRPARRLPSASHAIEVGQLGQCGRRSLELRNALPLTPTASEGGGQMAVANMVRKFTPVIIHRSDIALHVFRLTSYLESGFACKWGSRRRY